MLSKVGRVRLENQTTVRVSLDCGQWNEKSFICIPDLGCVRIFGNRTRGPPVAHPSWQHWDAFDPIRKSCWTILWRNSKMSIAFGIWNITRPVSRECLQMPFKSYVNLELDMYCRSWLYAVFHRSTKLAQVLRTGGLYTGRTWLRTESSRVWTNVALTRLNYQR